MTKSKTPSAISGKTQVKNLFKISQRKLRTQTIFSWGAIASDRDKIGWVRIIK